MEQIQLVSQGANVLYMNEFALLTFSPSVSIQTRREGADADTDESWSSPDTSDEEEGSPDHVQCMSS